ncbi:MAG: glycosyltransferase family 39 protein [Candidatus Woesearchaeota archaeon]
MSKPRRENKKNCKKEIIFLILLMALAFAIRFHNTGELSGGDDSQYGTMAGYIIKDPIKAIYPAFPADLTSLNNLKYNRPFAATPIVPFVLLLGYTSTAVKMPSIIFAVLTLIPLFYLLKRQFNTKIAYIASILFAFSPFHILFSRGGFLHSVLTFYIVLTIFFVVKAVEDKKKIYVYLAAMMFLINILTTDFRGILPLLCLIPYLFIKNNDLENIRKLKFLKIIKYFIVRYKQYIIAWSIVCILYLVYMIIPAILWNDTSHLKWIAYVTVHSLGLDKNYHGYMSFSENIIIMGKHLILTPFIGLIFISILYGILFSIKRIIKGIKKSEYILWLTYISISILFYINKQPYLQRQTVFTPSYAVLAGIGIYITYTKFIKNKSMAFPLLWGLSAIYSIIMLYMFPKLFNLKITNGFISHLLNIAREYYLIIILVISLFTIASIMIIKLIKWDKKRLKNGADLIIALFLLINILTASILVIYGIGIYKRPDAIKIISDFLDENTKGLEYVTVIHYEDKSILYYTQRKTANYAHINVSWIEEQVEKGDVKYFVFNIYQRVVGVGLETQSDISKSHPEQYEWIMQNTIDVTEKTGLAKDNPYFIVREYVKPENLSLA